MKRRWLAALGLVLSCSGQQKAGEPGAPPPLAKAATPNEPSNAVALVTGVSIEQFEPLLSHPALADAARALEQDNPRQAASRVASFIERTRPSGVEAARLHFLVGRLRERTGDLAGASRAYTDAQRQPWALTAYVQLALGRTALAQGRVADAITLLEGVPKDHPAAAAARLLLADAAIKEGRFDLAIDTWRDVLERDDATVRSPDIALGLAQALLERARQRPDESPAQADGDVIEALRVARRVAAKNAARRELTRRAEAVASRALEAIPPALRVAHAAPSPEDQLARVEALVDGREFESAERAADELLDSLGAAKGWGRVGCEAAIARGKAISSQRSTGRAADSLKDVLAHCTDADQRARALYLAGRYAARDGRHAQAVAHFAKLEQDHPAHRLADDARLLGALSYFDMGVEARFTELLASMPRDYPDGDMMLDGVFRLAMRRVEKNDWSGAASVLDRAAELVAGRDSSRGTELSGRERYFRARAWIETGAVEKGEAELRAIVQELPLSYYMLHAYSRLVEKDPFGARRIREEAAQKAATLPFSFPHRPEFDQPGFLRAMELLRQGELELARTELSALGLVRPGAQPELLWAVALLYARAGSAKHAHEVTRGLLTDWLARWPAGDWAKAWELAFPRPYHDVVSREAKKNGVPEALVYGVMREESAFDPAAVSHANAYGLMQVIVPTAKMLAKDVGLPYDPASLKRPNVSIALGSRGLSRLKQDFASNPVLAIPGYNAGPGRPRRWLRERPNQDFDVWVELIPFNETRRYTKRVLAARAAYAYLYASDTADEMMVLPIKLTR